MDEPILDKALTEIREETPDPAAVEDAARRVWSKLAEAGPHIRGCADFQALLKDYREGRLSEARALLVEDHLHECVKCRAASQGVVEMPAASAARSARTTPKWAVAAAVVATVGLSALGVNRYLESVPIASRVAVESVEGALYRVTAHGSTPLRAGEEMLSGDTIRTARDSRAMLLLGDGSRVEMRERSGLEVEQTRRNLTVRVESGSIIVQAAKRRSGRLYVATRDCRVWVTGTVFSVNSGVKGSRVAVIEGEVRVDPDAQRVLGPGDQFSSSANMSPVAIEDEIAWSRNVTGHVALLREFSALRREIEQVRMPDLRYSSRLIDLLPAGTAVFASVPNLGRTLGEVHQIFKQKVQDSPVLRQWWEEKMERSARARLEEMVGKIRGLSDYLGDEIVMAAALRSPGHLDAPVFLAEVKRPGLGEFLRTELSKSGAPPVQVIDDVDQAVAGGLVVLVRPNLVAISPEAGTLRQLSGGFAGTPLHAQVASSYRSGTGLLFTADLERIAADFRAQKSLAPPGLLEVRHLIVEQKQISGRNEARATVTFRERRNGVASWLASPAPMPALEFISSDAGFAAGFVVKNPAVIIDELFAWLASSSPDFKSKVAEGETKLGVNIRQDLAGSLGTEIVVAFDGPVLPAPAWKMAAEVYNAARLQWAIEKMAGQAGVRLSQEVAGGRTWYTLAAVGAPVAMEAHYTYVDTYLIAAPTRALVDQAIRNRAGGNSLARSQKFLSLMPRDHYTNVSGVVYQNIGSTIKPLVDGLPAEQRQAMGALAGDLQASLIAIYGEDDRLVLASTGSLFGLSVDHLIGMQGPMGMLRLLKKPGTNTRPPAYR